MVEHVLSTASTPGPCRLQPCIKEGKAPVCGHWQMRRAMGARTQRCTIMVLPAVGTWTRRPTDLPCAGRCQGLCATAAHRRAKQRTEAGWLEEYIGYMQDQGCTWTVQGMLGNEDENQKRGRRKRSTRVRWYLLHLILVRVRVRVEIRKVGHGADLPLLHDL